jgi:hypothetical protein
VIEIEEAGILNRAHFAKTTGALLAFHVDVLLESEHRSIWRLFGEFRRS